MGHQIPFPCNCWQPCCKVHFKLNLKTNCMPCPQYSSQESVPEQHFSTVRNHLICSQNVFVPIHTLWFCASTACYLRPFSSFLGALLLVRLESRDTVPSPLLTWLNMPRSLQMGFSVWRLSLESESAPVPSHSLCSWSRGDENGGRSQV